MKFLRRASLAALAVWLLAEAITFLPSNVRINRRRIELAVLWIDGSLVVTERDSAPVPPDDPRFLSAAAIYQIDPVETGVIAVRSQTRRWRFKFWPHDERVSEFDARNLCCAFAEQLPAGTRLSGLDLGRLAISDYDETEHRLTGYLADLSALIGLIAFIAAGMFLFDRSQRISRLIASGAICPNCRYDFSGLHPRICPECGYNTGLSKCSKSSPEHRQ